jgi:hypothetical protein
MEIVLIEKYLIFNLKCAIYEIINIDIFDKIGSKIPSSFLWKFVSLPYAI